ncbi:MAG: gamma-glutamylcyclotransferase [Alphaproteobacteria bacterium]|nr:gamma-glutamylcyclotransferase [Alphaproteobacteria bacterium]
MTNKNAPSTKQFKGPDLVANGDLWVFGYGSLMWRPGFEHVDVQPAMLGGYHREFCIYSHHHRGTSDHPGLVLGLDRGGCCRGLAFRVAADHVADVVAYLDERELVTSAYIPKSVPVRMGEERAHAYTFVADPTHRQYAGHLDADAAAAIIMDAQGQSGLNRDYLINTVRHLEGLGFTDGRVHKLLQRVEALTGEIEQGSGI